MFRKSRAALAALLAIVAAIALFGTASASTNGFVPMPVVAPHHHTMCDKAFSARIVVIAKHGSRAPGRNVCRFGVKYSNGVVLDATRGQKARYLRQLRLLIAPVPVFAKMVVGPPAQLPAGTLTAHIARAEPSGLESCIIRSESGGNPQANNGSHFGIGQWDIATWIAQGGGKYAQSPLGATYDEQRTILESALARFGCSAWCPYDPC